MLQLVNFLVTIKLYSDPFVFIVSCLHRKDHSFAWKSIPTSKKWDHSHTFLSCSFRDVSKIVLHVLRGMQGLSKAEMTFVGQFTCLNNFGINILIQQVTSRYELVK